jgi:virginiamycin B lyase
MYRGGAVRFTRGTIFVVTAVAAGVLVPAVVGTGGGAALAAGRQAGPVFKLFAGTNLPNQLVTGPDGAVWFTNDGSDSIGRVTPSGGFRTFTGPGIDSPNTITVGPGPAAPCGSPTTPPGRPGRAR